MSDDEIKNNPSFKKLRKDAEQFRVFGKVWPILRPLVKMLGADTKTIDKSLEKVEDLAKQVDEMTGIPDKFNDLFSESGWILFDSMSLDVAKQAIEIAENDSTDAADDFLANYFSPTWVEKRINWLKFNKGFRERFEFAQIALEDYKAGRFYSSVLVTLSLIGGWVSELNIIDFQRYGFFFRKESAYSLGLNFCSSKGIRKIERNF